MKPLHTLLLVFFLILSTIHSSSVFAEKTGFGGVGLQVVPTMTGELVVLNVLVQAPAAEQGMLPGDLIFKVNDFALVGSDFGKVVAEHLWGPVGSTVELGYRRPGVAGERSIVIKRTAIDPRLTVTPAVQSGPSTVRKGQ